MYLYIWLPNQLLSAAVAYPVVSCWRFQEDEFHSASSAAVDRLFVATAQVLAAPSRRMTDDTLDTLLFLSYTYKVGKKVSL